MHMGDVHADRQRENIRGIRDIPELTRSSGISINLQCCNIMHVSCLFLSHIQ